MPTSDPLQVQAFLEDAKDNPEDDTPRLVLADWLEDHGDPDRAQFIRVQCRLARLPEDDPEWSSLADQESELSQRCHGAWLAEIGIPPYEQRDYQRFRRGLLTDGGPVAGLLRRAKRLDPSRRAWVDGVSLFQQHDREGILRLLRSPWGEGLNTLELSFSRLGDEGVEVLANEAAVKRLHTLKLCGVGLTAAGVAALAHSQRFERLRCLELTSENLGRAMVGNLAQGALPEQLTALSLAHNRLGHGGILPLTSSPRFARLTRLDLTSSYLDNGSVRALARAAHLASLEELNLSANHAIGHAGVRALAESPYLGKLRHLKLDDARFGDAGLRVLAESDRLPGLCRLELASLGGWGTAALSSKGLRAFAGSPLAGRLLFLNLYANRLGDDGAAALAAWPEGAPLRTLNLAATGVGAAGLATLARARGLAGVARLDLWGNQSLRGLAALTESPLVESLVELQLSETGIGPRDVEALAAAPWRRLRHLRLRRTRLTDADVKLLAKAPGLAGLMTLDLAENPLDHASALALVRSPHLGGLRRLCLPRRLTPPTRKMLVNHFGAHRVEF
jgi:uncharacterized protein (TIGR02996 family)